MIQKLQNQLWKEHQGITDYSSSKQAAKVQTDILASDTHYCHPIIICIEDKNDYREIPGWWGNLGDHPKGLKRVAWKASGQAPFYFTLSHAFDGSLVIYIHTRWDTNPVHKLILCCVKTDL